MEHRDHEKMLNATPSNGVYVIRVDLLLDRYSVLKSDLGGWQPGEDSFSHQLDRFIQSGAIHPEDTRRFAAFTKLERIRSAPIEGQKALTLIYRRQTPDACRWNLMEVVPERNGASAVLRIKDIHDMLREILEREGLTARGQDLIRSLGAGSFNIYTIDLRSGQADSIQVDGQIREELVSAPWDELVHTQIEERLHEAYQHEFKSRFSLSSLRQAKESGQQKSELLCQWRSGGNYRYVSVTAYFSQDQNTRSYTVLALQDVDDHVRLELAHTQRDMEMAAILRSRFRTLTTVDLVSGQYQKTDLTQPAGAENILTGDYALYLQNIISTLVHPDDVDTCRAVLSLDPLREKAADLSGDYEEEVCLYRQRGETPLWVELRVIYSRQRSRVAVNILGQDVTREKQREESRRQALEDRAYIISSLSTLFFSTYYLDLEQDSFRAVTQLRRVGSLLGNEVNCTAALGIYANHFIHPNDRAEYLRVMNIQNLRQKLRWWQPYVAVEYRKLPDDPSAGSDSWEWVRATAVLARTGTDDMPKTAVYVAQNITGNERRLGTAGSGPL